MLYVTKGDEKRAVILVGKGLTFFERNLSLSMRETVPLCTFDNRFLYKDKDSDTLATCVMVKLIKITS